MRIKYTHFTQRGVENGAATNKYFLFFCLRPLRTGPSLDHQSDSSAVLPAEIFLTRRYTDRTPIGLHVSGTEGSFPPSGRPGVDVSRSEGEEESARCACSCGSSGYLMQLRTKQPPVMLQLVFSLLAVNCSFLTAGKTGTDEGFQNKSSEAW